MSVVVPVPVPLMNTFTPGKPVASSADVTLPVTVVCPKTTNCDINKTAKSSALFSKYKILIGFNFFGWIVLFNVYVIQTSSTCNVQPIELIRLARFDLLLPYFGKLVQEAEKDNTSSFVWFFKLEGGFCPQTVHQSN